MPDLVAEAKACQLCAADLPLGARPVFQLHPEAKILIAGQAPGRKVHESGIPFDDASGERLRDWLGVSREQFYDARHIAILPMGFCYPGTGRSGDLPPSPECASTWRQALLNSLQQLQLTVILGRYALDWHLQAKGISVTAAVKNWQAHWPEAIALPHPSPRNNRWLKQNPWFAQDVLPVLQRRTKQLLS